MFEGGGGEGVCNFSMVAKRSCFKLWWIINYFSDIYCVSKPTTWVNCSIINVHLSSSGSVFSAWTKILRCDIGLRVHVSCPTWRICYTPRTCRSLPTLIFVHDSPCSCCLQRRAHLVRRGLVYDVRLGFMHSSILFSFFQS